MTGGNTIPDFGGPENDASMQRIKWMGTIFHISDIAREADRQLNNFTKRFLMDFRPKDTEQFPFPHLRVRMTPQNTLPDTGIEVAGIRFSQDDEGNVNEDVAFISWELTDGTEEYFALTVEQFSRVDIDLVFSQMDQGVLLAPDALAPASDLEIGNLLIVINGFEPDLQNNKFDLKR